MQNKNYISLLSHEKKLVMTTETTAELGLGIHFLDSYFLAEIAKKPVEKKPVDIDDEDDSIADDDDDKFDFDDDDDEDVDDSNW